MFLKGSVEEKERYIKEMYRDKCRLSGKNAAVIKKIHGIVNNNRSNPDKLVGVEGIWAAGLLLKYDIIVHALILDVDAITTPDAFQIMESLAKIAEEIHLVSHSTYSKISEVGTSAGIFALAKFPIKKLDMINAASSEVIVVLDGLEIPGNIGTIIRSCDGTNTDAIFICNRKTRITHPKILRSSQGSCFKVPIVEEESATIIKWLRDNNYRIILTDTDAEHFYYDTNYHGKIAIIMGSERYGISKEWYDIPTEAVKIPMYGDCDSLNVGIAATLMLYEAAIYRSGDRTKITKNA